jgi:electron transfer flavoprotein alpha subunit
MNQDIYVLVEQFKGKVTDMACMALAQAKELAAASGGKVVGVLLGHNVAGLAKDLAADKVLLYEDPALADFTWDAYLKVLAGLIQTELPRLVLLGETTIGADTASGLSARLSLPLVGYCARIEAAGGTFKYTSQVCGGKLLAQGVLPDGTVLVTLVPGAFKAEQGKSATSPQLVSMAPPPLALADLRVKLTHYIEPEGGDVDISKEALLVSVGRGLQNQDNLEMAQELADALGAVVTGSRPVTDQGWLATSRLVGKSGKSVHPKVYLALGISGAPEHTEAITGSEMIIAINTDPVAPIFNLAKYGAVVDMLDLLPVLTDQVRLAKGG